MPDLYKFTRLENSLKRNGFKVEHNGIYVPIVHELSLDEQYNNIEFAEDGVIYTDDNGREWTGFVYKKYKYIGNGGKDDYPKMHLCHCGVTDTWGEEEYFFANTLPIVCYDTADDHQVREIQNIDMCETCKIIRKNKGWPVYRDAKQYVKYIKSLYSMEETFEVTRWGYTRDWHRVKEDYAEKRGYICEKCGANLSNIFTRSCLYVYHKDRFLANNNENNLQCLCVDCYMKSYGVEVTDEMKIKSRSLHDFWEEKPIVRKVSAPNYDADLMEHLYFQRLSNEDKLKLQEIARRIKVFIFGNIKDGCYEELTLIKDVYDKFENETRFVEFLDEKMFYISILSLKVEYKDEKRTLRKWIEYFKNRKPKWVQGNLFD